MALKNPKVRETNSARFLQMLIFGIGPQRDVMREGFFLVCH